ncbi:MAG: SpoIIIAH-like family protein [Oscillospiraceae bacterium]
MKSAKTKRQLTLLTLVLALGVAVYLNWEYAKNDANLPLADGQIVSTGAIEPMGLNTSTSGETTEVVTDGESAEDLPNKNYGDAQLVSAGVQDSNKYFEEARLTRSKTRDDALDKLQKTLKNAKLTAEEKKQSTDILNANIQAITKEGDIENMIKAKGFVDCVAFIDKDKINIAVKTGSDALDKSEVAQIRDIILSKFETQAKNITVVEVK